MYVLAVFSTVDESLRRAGARSVFPPDANHLHRRPLNPKYLFM